jgi:3'-phosphoadenosine 5'-phosphosulfate sulfotransferase (PAPS reductase)/FAD synthetase
MSVRGMTVATDPQVNALLFQNAPVAIGVSGGKDSTIAAFETAEYLNSIGHEGERILIHSDLGRVEWQDSLRTCERLASKLEMELIVVRRQAGDMMDRWLTRWKNNVARYINLECVKLILPWSTASMRFCTSELKTAVICSYLVKRFPGQQILSVTGIRRDESPNRRKASICSVQKKLTNKTHRTSGFDWHPILDFTLADVLSGHKRRRFALHEAYTTFGSSRVSCAFCILGSQSDFRASASCTENQDIYREMVELEAESTFSFQDKHWLGDTAPELLSQDLLTRLARAKDLARQRERLEAQIPKHLLYVKGWPVFVPTWDEATLIANVRRQVGKIMGLKVEYTDPYSVIDRHQELMFIQDHRSK